MSTHHLNYRITVLLGMNDEDLEELTEKSAKEVRPLLEEKKAAGEVYLPAAGCEGFDPVTGCPGHSSGVF